MTLHKVTFILAVAGCLLGLAHLGLAMFIYPAWTIDALWFVGTGFAIVIGAATNIAAINASDRSSRAIMAISNMMLAGYFVAAWSVLPGPQIIVGALVFAGLALCALRAAIPPLSLNGQ